MVDGRDSNPDLQGYRASPTLACFRDSFTVCGVDTTRPSKGCCCPALNRASPCHHHRPRFQFTDDLCTWSNSGIAHAPVGTTACSVRFIRPQHQMFTMASSAGLEPATCGLGIRCSDPSELRGQMVGTAGLEPATLALSRRCSGQLSYAPKIVGCQELESCSID